LECGFVWAVQNCAEVLTAGLYDLAVFVALEGEGPGQLNESAFVRDEAIIRTEQVIGYNEMMAVSWRRASG
jgi:hypothetical protein